MEMAAFPAGHRFVYGTCLPAPVNYWSGLGGWAMHPFQGCAQSLSHSPSRRAMPTSSSQINDLIQQLPSSYADKVRLKNDVKRLLGISDGNWLTSLFGPGDVSKGPRAWVLPAAAPFVSLCDLYITFSCAFNHVSDENVFFLCSDFHGAFWSEIICNELVFSAEKKHRQPLND